MYSFYGGRPGNSFVIITTYRSVADMVKEFKKGPNYTAVHYDEHVMINTDNKNSEENGRIYKRGYDYTNDMGGAEYIGTIVGPAGKSPQLKISSYQWVKNQIDDVLSSDVNVSSDKEESDGEFSRKNGALVPGKTKNNFNDTIKWICCSVREKNGSDTTAYIGLTIPYPVIDFEVNEVTQYVGGLRDSVATINRTDDGQHPFYEKWLIDVPKGIKGDSINNLRVITPTTKNVFDYDGRENDIMHNRKILAYTQYCYDEKQGGDPTTYYFGDYNMISNIEIDDFGTVSIDYTHNDRDNFFNRIRWLNDLQVEDDGSIDLIWNFNNTGSPSILYNRLHWIKDIDCDNTGTVTFTWNDHNKEDRLNNNEIIDHQTILPKQLRWIVDANCEEDGTFSLTWNNNGINDGNAMENENMNQFQQILPHKIQWFKDVKLSSDGTLTFIWNDHDISLDSDYYDDDDTPSLPGTGISHKTTVANKIQWFKNVNLNQSNGTLTFTWNDDRTEHQHKDTFNDVCWINNAKLEANGQLRLFFSDDQAQGGILDWGWPQAPGGGPVYDQNGHQVYYRYQHSHEVVCANKIKWITDIVFDETYGDITFKMNTQENAKPVDQEHPDNLPQNERNIHYYQPIKWIKNVELDEDANILLTWSDHGAENVNNNNETYTVHHQTILPLARTLGRYYKYANGKDNNPGWGAGGEAERLTLSTTGALIDDGTHAKTIQFTIIPDGFIDPAVNQIDMGFSYIDYAECGTSTTPTRMQMITGTEATVRKSIEGLEVTIQTTENSSGTESIKFVNILITNMYIIFKTVNTQ